MIALVAATLGACSSEDNEPVPQQPATQQPTTQPEARPLTITVSETPFINPDDQSGSRGTRAAITTTSTLAEFKMDYVYTYGESRLTNGTAWTASKDGEGKWKTTDGVWPTVDNDRTIDWYAYSNASFIKGATASEDYIHFEVNNSSIYQHDLVVAKTSATYNSCKGNISLTFDHACAALRFWMKKAKNLSDYTLTVSNVVLHNVVKEGDYYFGSQSWTLGATTFDYPLYSASPATSLGDTDFIALDTSAGPYLFLIPQTLTPWDPSGALSNTYLEITCTITKADFSYTGDAYIPFGFELEKGTQYDVNINIGKNSLYKVVEGVASKIITD